MPQGALKRKRGGFGGLREEGTSYTYGIVNCIPQWATPETRAALQLAEDKHTGTYLPR